MLADSQLGPVWNMCSWRKKGSPRAHSGKIRLCPSLLGTAFPFIPLLKARGQPLMPQEEVRKLEEGPRGCPHTAPGTCAVTENGARQRALGIRLYHPWEGPGAGVQDFRILELTPDQEQNPPCQFCLILLTNQATFWPFVTTLLCAMDPASTEVPVDRKVPGAQTGQTREAPGGGRAGGGTTLPGGLHTLASSQAAAETPSQPESPARTCPHVAPLSALSPFSSQPRGPRRVGWPQSRPQVTSAPIQSAVTAGAPAKGLGAPILHPPLKPGHLQTVGAQGTPGLGTLRPDITSSKGHVSGDSPCHGTRLNVSPFLHFPGLPPQEGLLGPGVVFLAGAPRMWPW